MFGKIKRIRKAILKVWSQNPWKTLRLFMGWGWGPTDQNYFQSNSETLLTFIALQCFPETI